MSDKDKKQGGAPLPDKGDVPADKEQLAQALAAQQNATGLLAKASSLKDKATKCLNPQERQRMLQEAFNKEVEAHGQSKAARRMQSGPWQGGVGGAGIGGGVGMGLGAVVGTLVGGVVSVPTTAVGGLVGMGVGGVHGPWIRLDQVKAKDVVEREKAQGKSQSEIEEAVKKEAVIEVIEEGEEGDPKAPATRRATISQPKAGSAKKHLEGQRSTPSDQQQAAGSAADPDPNNPRRKPRKLEIRSNKKGSSTTKLDTESVANRSGK